MGKAKHKIKRAKVVDPIMGFHWLLQIGGSERSAIDWYTKTFNLSPDTEGVAQNLGSFITNADIPYSGAIWISEGAGSGTMAHEGAHAVAHVCRVLEMDPREADEFQALYAGYLMRYMNKLAHKR